MCLSCLTFLLSLRCLSCLPCLTCLIFLIWLTWLTYLTCITFLTCFTSLRCLRCLTFPDKFNSRGLSEDYLFVNNCGQNAFIPLLLANKKLTKTNFCKKCLFFASSKILFIKYSSEEIRELKANLYFKKWFLIYCIASHCYVTVKAELDVITLGRSQTDNINPIITISDVLLIQSS
jgi:hypothetical protein